ncbi:MAG: class I SAM-dependent methyltransferase [Verrucomicrobiota bacterium]
METATLINASVACKTKHGTQLHATLLRFSQRQIVLEIYDPQTVLRTSEVFSEVKIEVEKQIVYSGPAIICSLINTGATMICEVNLDTVLLAGESPSGTVTNFGDRFDSFMGEWQKNYKVVPEYKVLIADMQTFLEDLRLWLEHIEAELSTSENRIERERKAIAEMSPPIIGVINTFFDKFEEIANRLTDATRPAHEAYMKRQLHWLVLCSPFAYRTFQKPLGYAGDYEMVNMMMRPTEGNSLFAKIVNQWFLQQPPAEAHRNRVIHLEQRLVEETLRVSPERPMQVFNLGCGPAWEVQKFLSERHFSGRTEITLVDFNDETLQNTRETLHDIRNKFGRTTRLEFVKRSVQQVIKDGARLSANSPQYDMVYCAGLFDYLSDQVCLRLMNIFYEMVRPGGLVLATNVDVSNPLRNGMEHLLDWHLIYRTSQQARALIPDKAAPDDFSVTSDITGVNIFIEVRKPN